MACVAVICSPRHEGQFKPTANSVPMASEKTKTKKNREEKEEGSEWDCVVCTFRNATKAFKCAVCDTRKPSSTRKNSLEMPQSPTRPTSFLSSSSKPLTPSNKKTTKIEKEKKKGSGTLKRSLTEEKSATNPSAPAFKKAKKDPVQKETKKDPADGKKGEEGQKKIPSTPVTKETIEKEKKSREMKVKTKMSSPPKRKLTKETTKNLSAKPSASKKAKKETKSETDQGSSLSPWNCPACTFENRGGAYKCAMCETRKGSSTRRSIIMDEVPKELATPSDNKKKMEKKGKETKKETSTSATPAKNSSAEKKRLSHGARTSATARVVTQKKTVKNEVKKEVKKEGKKEGMKEGKKEGMKEGKKEEKKEGKKEGKKEAKKIVKKKEDEKKEIKKEEKNDEKNEVKKEESTDETPSVSLIKNGSNGKSGFGVEVKVLPVVKKEIPIAKKKPKMGLTVDKKKPEQGTVWDCIMCTYKNKAAAYKCEMCNTKKSSATRRSSIVEEISRKKNSLSTPLVQ